ncbi:MAG TPA: hypothetical protein O0X21_02710 [Methanocorpusculum sp.]|jgi:ribosomal protein L4|nr:hypothetical protein [Methanocorpusculum parvum]MBR4285350.1 hypothetical protein [Methanocorpusculum sp.]MBR5008253.1 hypothetical protein [Methanocorpusculum sp.]MBR5449973.1 hypothetical protein [Methanocorpusculum sp.]HJJ71516.1 hypothetical protein [Methanocorpusculum sp.]
MKTPQEYLDIIQDAHPCPVNTGFERAAWLFETREALRWMLDFVELEYKHQIAEIQDQNLTSEKYNLYARYRNYTKVKVREVEHYSTELFEKLVHIKATDAEKILGRQNLYREAANLLGSDIQRYETVNATELAKAVPQHVYDRLTEKEERLMDYEIEEVTET